MKFQFVNWYPRWMGFGFMKSEGSIKMVYDWYIFFLCFEIRKWKD